MQVGQIVDNLGVDIPLVDTDQVTSLIVVGTYFADGDSQPRMFVAESEGLSWIERTGLLVLAETETQPAWAREDD